MTPKAELQWCKFTTCVIVTTTGLLFVSLRSAPGHLHYLQPCRSSKLVLSYDEGLLLLGEENGVS